MTARRVFTVVDVVATNDRSGHYCCCLPRRRRRRSRITKNSPTMAAAASNPSVGGGGGGDQERELDGRVVGTPALMDSPLIVRAPDRINRPVPVPSVYRDGRGEIHNLLVGGRRLNLLHTRRGVLRSGDVHAHPQRDFVFDGRVRVTMLTKPTGENGAPNNAGNATTTTATETTNIYSTNEYVAIPAYTPHLFEFLEDTVMAEWWDGPFAAWFYEPYRRRVEESLAAATDEGGAKQRPPGRFSRYVLQEDGATTTTTLSQNEYGKVLSSRLWWTGLVIGLSMGYLIGSRRRQI